MITKIIIHVDCRGESWWLTDNWLNSFVFVLFFCRDTHYIHFILVIDSSFLSSFPFMSLIFLLNNSFFFHFYFFYCILYFIYIYIYIYFLWLQCFGIIFCKVFCVCVYTYMCAHIHTLYCLYVCIYTHTHYRYIDIKTFNYIDKYNL